MPDGRTQREQLLAIADVTPERPAELDLPTEPPPRFRWTWTVFHDLASKRQYTDRGIPQRISNQEILAWCTLNGERLSRRQLSTISGLDSAWINSRMELQRHIDG
jgi:hypothetical protein